jgi:hypothetical protein
VSLGHKLSFQELDFRTTASRQDQQPERGDHVLRLVAIGSRGRALSCSDTAPNRRISSTESARRQSCAYPPQA